MEVSNTKLMNFQLSFNKLVLPLFLMGINLTIHAADVTSYGVLKGQKFFQFGPGSPFPASTAFEAFVMAAAAGSLSEGTVQPPGGGALVTLDPLDNPNRFTYEEEFSSLGELNTT